MHAVDTCCMMWKLAAYAILLYVCHDQQICHSKHMSPDPALDRLVMHLKGGCSINSPASMIQANQSNDNASSFQDSVFSS